MVYKTMFCDDQDCPNHKHHQHQSKHWCAYYHSEKDRCNGDLNCLLPSKLQPFELTQNFLQNPLSSIIITNPNHLN